MLPSLRSHSNITEAATYLEKVCHQAVVSHLENWSLWVLVDSNNGLGKSRTWYDYSVCVVFSFYGHQHFSHHFICYRIDWFPSHFAQWLWQNWAQLWLIFMKLKTTEGFLSVFAIWDKEIIPCCLSFQPSVGWLQRSQRQCTTPVDT